MSRKKDQTAAIPCEGLNGRRVTVFEVTESMLDQSMSDPSSWIEVGKEYLLSDGSACNVVKDVGFSSVQTGEILRRLA
jgi:hypothetical protein